MDTRAAKAGLPPVDSFSLAPILLGTTKLSPRKELALGNPINGGPHMGGFVGGLIQWPWKRKCSSPLRRHSQTALTRSCCAVLLGDVAMAGWTGPQDPNSSTDTHCFDSTSANPSKMPLPCAPACLCTAHCGQTGCLFNIETDPTEHHDVASSNLAIARKMLARVVQLNDTRVPPAKGGLYNPVRGTVQPAACAKAMGEYRGFWGPWME